MPSWLGLGLRVRLRLRLRLRVGLRLRLRVRKREAEVRVAHEEARDHGRVERLPRHLHGHGEHEVLALGELPLALREHAVVAW